MQFRSTVEPLANDIARSMPMFTDHSIHHIDSLWDTASLVCGDDYPLNPAEAFVLGGAFLLHDLGMGLVAYPGGVDAVKADPQFDNLTMTIRSRIEEETGSSGSDIEALATEEAIVSLLRLRHAKQAERLVGELFKVPGGTNFYLLQDANLRQIFGPLIGKIAHSHWWNVNELAEQFNQVRGSAPDQPADWSVDPLKVACILRLADAAHIDSRRAPTFLHAFRKPPGLSGRHWYFQQRLTRPLVVDERLQYTSTESFRHNEAASWWLAFETIQMIDRELRQVDALCADLRRPRFSARSVAGADSPNRFASFVPTDGWRPMDARLRVSQVNHLIGSLGGRFLYGRTGMIPLRELIANAADATKARLAAHGGSDAVVSVRLENVDETWWLTVVDQGIGMDATTLVGALTDFGRSFWKSDTMLQQYPRILANGFKPTGKFGIGFFSTFMIADEVHIKSLKYFDAPKNTHVLDFPAGLQERPLLRVADEDERLHIGGTEVRVRLKIAADQQDGFLWYGGGESVEDVLRNKVTELCALADVDIEVQGPTDPVPTRIVRANDWRHIPLNVLFERMHMSNRKYRGFREILDEIREAYCASASDIMTSDGEVVGRAALAPRLLLRGSGHVILPYFLLQAKVYVGGLYASSLRGVIGVFQGYPLKADRNDGFPIASPIDLQRWVRDQVGKARQLLAGSPDSLFDLARVVESFGEDIGELPCALRGNEGVGRSDLLQWASTRSNIVVLAADEFGRYQKNDGSMVYFCETNGREIALPENALLSAFRSDWIYPIDSVPRPRITLETPVDKATHLLSGWSQYGCWGTVNTMLGTIAEAWGLSTETLLIGAIDYQAYADTDYLDVPYADGDGAVKVSAIVFSRSS
jgi:hypothetical protein